MWETLQAEGQVMLHLYPNTLHIFNDKNAIQPLELFHAIANALLYSATFRREKTPHCTPKCCDQWGAMQHIYQQPVGIVHAAPLKHQVMQELLQDNNKAYGSHAYNLLTTRAAYFFNVCQVNAVQKDSE